MQMRIDDAVAVKPELIRFNIEITEPYDDGHEESIVAELQIVLHTNEFTLLKTKDDTSVEMEIDLYALQQRLTEEAAKMNMTSGIASAIRRLDLCWNLEESQDDTIPTNDGQGQTDDNKDSNAKE